jgi:hypothetical protein
MAGHYDPNNLPHKRMTKMQTQLKCIQINLQNSRLATDNLLKITEDNNTDIVCNQESYTMQNKTVGLKKKKFTSVEGRNRAAIVVNKKIK